MQESSSKHGLTGAGKGNPGLPTSFIEFVVLMALLMALTALSIDIMLPALPQIGEVFSLSVPNERQLVLTSYLVGLAAGQLVAGFLSDRFGRKRVLLAGLWLFVLGTVSAVLVGNFKLLLAARLLQGFGAAAPRVISIAIIRDLFSGRQMARVMSLVMMIFISVPVFAPAIGQGLLTVGQWTWTFHLLLGAGLVSIVWSFLRLPETHGVAPGRNVGLVEATRYVLRSGQTVGYAVATGFVLGCLMAYITSAQQVFVDVYKLDHSFPIVFGLVAGVQVAAAFTNAQLVQRLGMRLVSHSALTAFCAASMLLAVSAFFTPPLWLFCALLAISFFSFGLIVPNFNSIAMQPLGAVAGTASSFVGFYTTAAGALLGWLVGQSFDGTVRPLALGFAFMGLLAFATVAITESGRGMFGGE